MPALPVSDRPSSFGQAERSIDGNEIGPGLSYLVQYVVIAERDVRVGPQAAKKTDTGRTARRTCDVDPKNDKSLAGRRVSTPFYAACARSSPARSNLARLAAAS